MPHLSPKKQATPVKNYGNLGEMMAEGTPQHSEAYNRNPGRLRQNELNSKYKLCANGEMLAIHEGQKTGRKHLTPLLNFTIPLLYNYR